MVTCGFCGTANRADATFCNHCGGALKPVATPSAAAGASVYARSPQAASTAGTSTTTTTNKTGRLPPQAQLAGRYLILKNVGQGGMAAVYKATELRSGTTVAIKEMSQDGLSPSDLAEALDSFRSEAKMLAGLRHPNLPRVYESFEENARQYLVMEFIEGETLEQKQQHAAGGALPQADVLGWARQLCDVLSYLHQHKPPIIFRDLKPANIMLTPKGQIKLIDFGIARVFAPGRAHDTQVLGTPGFAPPEQYGKAQTDARADIYALGCTLYQLLTGYDPATTPFNLPPMHSRNPNVSPVVQVAIERATKLDRDARYPTVDAFSHDLLAGRGAPRTTMAHTAVNPSTTTTNTKTRAAGAARAAPTSMAAVVVVQPHDVDFGRLLAGQRGTLAITVSGQNGARIRGQIKSLAPWLTVDRDRFDGASTIVRLNAETSRIAGAGRQKTTLQIICDNQQLYVPVQVEILPAPAQRPKPPTNTAAKPRATNRAAPSAKYAPAARLRSRLPRFLTSSVLAFAVTGETLALGRTVIPQVWAHPLTAPVAMGLFLLAAVLGGVGAVFGAGGRHWSGRFGTTLIGALVGLVVTLMVSGPWFWYGVRAFLTHAVTIPTAVMVLLPLLAGLGAALGADPVHSRWMLAIWGFVRRNAPVVVTTVAVLAGAYLGYMVTRGAFLGCLTPLGIVAGILLGVAVARPTNRLLRRPARVRMRP